MQLQIVARNLELTSSQREIVERRLGFALGRFGNRVRIVSVRFTDVNGPRGGVDTTCRIVATIVPKGEVRVEVTDVGVEAAVSRAAKRIARRVSTELDRRRTTKRVRAAPYADGVGSAGNG
jgi:ribosome-associated translation inhibitor RaiA